MFVTVEEWQCVKTTMPSRIRLAPIFAMQFFDASRSFRNLLALDATTSASASTSFFPLSSTWLIIHRTAFRISGSVDLEANKTSRASPSSLVNSFRVLAIVSPANASTAFMAAMATFLAPWTSSLLILSAVTRTVSMEFHPLFQLLHGEAYKAIPTSC
jgi:hypothetical protein